MNSLYGGPGCYENRMYKKCEGTDELPISFRPVWSKKTKYDSMDPEMAGMVVDFIDEEAARKAKQPRTTSNRHR